MNNEKSQIKVSITGLDENPSKSDEVAVLERLVEMFICKQWYLSLLFSKDLLEWFRGQVAQDVSCDLMGEFGFSRDQVMNAESRANTLKTDLESQAKIHDAKLSEFKRVYEDEISKLRNELDRTKEREAEYADELGKEHVRNLFADCTIRQDRSTIDVLEVEIIRLKARLYDLMTKEVATE
jgi:hypothetical protein